MLNTEQDAQDAANAYADSLVVKDGDRNRDVSVAVVKSFLAGVKWQEECRYLLEHGKPMS